VRVGAYRLFEIVAWPAAAWGAVEVALRAAMGEPGIGGALLTCVCAAGMIAASRARTRQLAVARVNHSGRRP
jgi:hypothetical protein